MFKKWHSKKQKYIKKIHSFLLFCHRDTFLNGMNTLKDLGINSTLFIDQVPQRFQIVKKYIFADYKKKPKSLKLISKPFKNLLKTTMVMFTIH